MKATNHFWNRDVLRHMLTHHLGGKGTGGGQTMCGTSWDESADFLLPNGRRLSVMFTVGGMVAEIGVFDHQAEPAELLRYSGEPAAVLNVLTAKLEALGYRTPRRS